MKQPRFLLLETRLAELEQTHAIQITEVMKDSDVACAEGYSRVGQARDGSARGRAPAFRLFLEPDVPVVVHGRYLDLELSAAFAATTRGQGLYKNFYTGVEPVCDGRYDLLLVTLDKGDVRHEHLQYADFRRRCRQSGCGVGAT